MNDEQIYRCGIRIVIDHISDDDVIDGSYDIFTCRLKEWHSFRQFVRLSSGGKEPHQLTAKSVENLWKNFKSAKEQ